MDGHASSATVFIITVGTPLDENGKAQIGLVEAATREVAALMPDGALVILRSTVKIGTSRNVVQPILEASGKKFDLAVCPERTLEGKALIELHELPQIIGSADIDTRFRCSRLFSILTPTTIQVSSLETAELIKLVDNTYRDVRFAFANEVAHLCSHAGISAREVISAGKLGYPRTDVALPGPVGGPCLEKDPHILAESASQWGVEMHITRAARNMNEVQPRLAVEIIKHWTEKLEGFASSPRITLMGVGFKGVPATDDLRGTMAMPIYEALSSAYPQAEFRAFDEVVSKGDIRSFFGIEAVDTLEAAFSDSDLVVIANNHPVFQTMDPAALGQKMRKPGIIYDFWNLHDNLEMNMPEGVRYLALGSEKVES